MTLATQQWGWDGPPAFTRSPDQWGMAGSPASFGLVYGYKGGVAIDEAGVYGIIPDGSVVLADNATNYVERTIAGVVSVNQVGFSKSKIPMAKIVTLAGAM